MEVQTEEFYKSVVLKWMWFSMRVINHNGGLLFGFYWIFILPSQWFL